MNRRNPESYVSSKINSFTILSIATQTCSNRPVKIYTCRCDCGKEFTYQASKVFSNQLVSCGCMGRSKRAENRSVRDQLYIVWTGMKNRCTNPADDSYRWYGGRGIGVSAEWTVFEQFYSDMKEGYQKGLDLDRIDSSLGYSKENCCWITHQKNIWTQSGEGGESKYVGVSLDRRTGNWVAAIRKDDKTVKLGTYTTEEEAALVYDDHCLSLRGEFARLNQHVFPAILNETKFCIAA